MTSWAVVEEEVWFQIPKASIPMVENWGVPDMQDTSNRLATAPTFLYARN